MWCFVVVAAAEVGARRRRRARVLHAWRVHVCRDVCGTVCTEYARSVRCGSIRAAHDYAHARVCSSARCRSHTAVVAYTCSFPGWCGACPAPQHAFCASRATARARNACDGARCAASSVRGCCTAMLLKVEAAVKHEKRVARLIRSVSCASSRPGSGSRGGARDGRCRGTKCRRLYRRARARQHTAAAQRQPSRRAHCPSAYCGCETSA